MKALRIISLILVLVMFSSLLLACNTTDNPTPSETEAPTEAPTNKPTNKPTSKPTSKPTNKPTDDSNDELEEEFTPAYENGLSIEGVDISEFVIVYSEDAPNTVKGFATETLPEWIYEASGVEIEAVDDSTAEVENEILVGDTNRDDYNLTVPTDSMYNYKISAKDGKLIIAANKKNGFNAALASIACAFAENDGDMDNGQLSNDNISYNDMQDYISGAIRYKVNSDGLQAYRSTEAQQQTWSVHTANWENNKTCPESAALIYFDFDTNSSYLNVSVAGGNIFVFVNDELVSRDTSSYVNTKIDNDNGRKTNHITVLLPTGNSKNWKITNLEIAGGAVMEKHKTDLNILILGDSITEGYNNHGNPHSTYTFTIKQMLNANVLNQGYSGSQIWVDMLDPAVANAFSPDLIIIALGTNDYANGQRADGLKSRMNAYLDKLEDIYPDVPIAGLTPIARLDKATMSVFDSNLKNSSVGLIEAFEAHGALAIDAEDFCEHNVDYYADYVHPNEYGFPVYGKHICDAIKDLVTEIVEDKNS